MKKILLLLLMFIGLMPVVVNAGMSAVVTNVSGAGTLEDSVTVAFVVTDSIGNISGLDSIFVAIFDPNGDSVYAAAYITTADEIDSMDLGGSRIVWRWTEQIADIDASGRIGTYTGIVVGVDTIAGAGAEYLDQSSFFSFQLINAQYSSLLDSVGIASLLAAQSIDSLADVLDSLEAQSVWLQDSIFAIIDTLQLWDTRVDSIEAALADVNIGDKVWADGSQSNRDEINDILDTLQLYDTRFDSLLAALADANIGDKVWTDGSFSPRTSIQPILDTLQLWDTRIDSIEAALADGSISDKVWADGTPANRAEINDILDTLQNQDNWGAKEASLTAVRDSLQYLVTGAGGSSPTVEQIYAEFIRVSNEDAFKATGFSTLSASDNIGINLDDVSGTLDAGEIGADAITAAKIADNAIAAEHLADDAIDYATFAESAPGAWWNEAKTGYALSATGVDAIWNEDTTGHKTEPQMGWMITQGGTATISASDMGDIGDSSAQRVWNHLIDTAWGAGSMGDSAKTWAKTGAAAGGITEAQTWAMFDTITAGVAPFSTFDETSDSVIVDGSSLGATANAITATTIADDAIDYATFAATAPTAWWNIGKSGFALTTADWNVGKTGYALTTADWNVGKTGYSLAANQSTVTIGTVTTATTATNLTNNNDKTGYTVSTVSDKTGYALSAAGVAAVWDEDTTGHKTEPNMGYWITQGGSASISDAQMGGIADSVWQALANQYTAVPGSFGDALYDSLDAQISSAGGTASISDADMASIIDSLFIRVAADTVSGSLLAEMLRNAVAGGSGGNAYTRTVYVVDTVGTDAPVADASVYFNNEAQTGSPYSATTNANGLATFNLDAADWVILMNEVGYKSITDSVTVAAAATDTIETYPTFPTTTPPNQATVTGTLLDAHGNPNVTAEVRFELVAVPVDSILEYDGAVIVQMLVYDTTNASGEFSVSIYPNDSLSDSSYYKVDFYDSSGDIINRESRNKVHVPTAAVVSFNDLTKWK